MINQETGLINITTESGKTLDVQTIFEFEVPELKKKYLAYTLEANSPMDEINVLISEFDYDTNEIKSILENEKEVVLEFYNAAKEAILNDDK